MKLKFNRQGFDGTESGYAPVNVCWVWLEVWGFLYSVVHPATKLLVCVLCRLWRKFTQQWQLGQMINIAHIWIPWRPHLWETCMEQKIHIQSMMMKKKIVLILILWALLTAAHPLQVRWVVFLMGVYVFLFSAFIILWTCWTLCIPNYHAQLHSDCLVK
jgi:hypothetical protein